MALTPYHSKLPVVATFPKEWQPEIADEIQYRLAHGIGGCRILNVARDAILAAPLAGLVAVLPTHRALCIGVTIGCGPTLRNKLDEAVLSGWTRSGYARAALRAYLDLSIFDRPRNILGSDPAFDPLNEPKE